MKKTRMPPVYAANLLANSDNTIYMYWNEPQFYIALFVKPVFNIVKLLCISVLVI